MRIKLTEDTYLCVDTSPDPYKEVDIYIEKNGTIWQDLAVVRERYKYNPDLENVHGEYEVFVYGDETSEDYTHHFVIKEYTDA